MLWSHCTHQLSTSLSEACLRFEITLFNTKVSVSISLSNILTDLFHAVWHIRGRRPVKVAGGPALKFKSELQTHLSKTMCVQAELWKQKPSLFTLSSLIWDCDALSWLHKYTSSEWFKWRGNVKASLPQCEQDIELNKGRHVQGEISHVVNMERILSFLLYF